MITAGHFRLALVALAIPSVCAFADGTGTDESSPASMPDETASKDKSSYTIFNPVPRDLMRELTPDRPDKTESPYTVDAGHFQLEMDFANFTLDESNDVRTRAWNVAPFNVKIGLLNNVDLQFVFDNYLWVHTHDHITRATSIQSGVGDFTLRLKINLWGDDGGQTAFGFLPFVKFPTNTDQLGDRCPFPAERSGPLLPRGVCELGNIRTRAYRKTRWLSRIFQQRQHRTRVAVDRHDRFRPDLCNRRKFAARLRLQRWCHALRRRSERFHRHHCSFLKTNQSLHQ